MNTAGLTHHFSSEQKHVTFTEKLFGTTLVKHDLRIDARADGEGNAARNVGFDKASDNLNLRTLSGKYEMDACGATFLSDANDEHFEVFPCHHHKIGHFVDNNDDVRHFAAFFGILLFSDFGVIIADVFNFFFRHQGIAAFHFANRPFHGRESFVGLGDDRGEKMRNVLVLRHFYLFRVNDNKLHVGGSITIKKRANKSIGHNGFTGAGGTGDEEVGHFSEVSNNSATRDVFTYGESERVGGFFPFVGLDNAAHTNIGRASVRNFDANRASTWNRGFDTNLIDGEIKGELFVASENFGEIDASRRTHGVLSDAGADIGAFHFNFNTELRKSRFDNVGVLLDVAGVGGRLFLF